MTQAYKLYELTNRIEVELIAIFKEKDLCIDGDHEDLTLLFENVMLLRDFENGEIEGYKYNEDTVFFKGEWDSDMYITLYSLYKEEMTADEIEYFRKNTPMTNEKNMEFLNSLQEGDVITFKASIGITSEFDKNLGNIYYHMQPFNEDFLRIWDVKRYGDKYTAEEMKLYEYESYI